LERSPAEASYKRRPRSRPSRAIEFVREVLRQKASHVGFRLNWLDAEPFHVGNNPGWRKNRENQRYGSQARHKHNSGQGDTQPAQARTRLRQLLPEDSASGVLHGIYQRQIIILALERHHYGQEDEVCHAQEAIAFPIAVEDQEAESSNLDEGADRSEHPDLLANKWQRWQFDVLVNRFYIAQVFERREVM